MSMLRAIVFGVVTEMLLFSLFGCSPDMAGATTETTNGVAGVVHNSDTTPAADAIVKLLPSGYNPMDSAVPGVYHTDTTDKEGNYRFSRIAAGSYTIIARKQTNGTSFLKRDVLVNEDSVSNVSEGVLAGCGTISTEFSPDEQVSDGYVYIPGTDIAAAVAGDGATVLDDVPVGLFDELVFVSTEEERFNILRGELAVVSDSTVSIEQPLWKYRCRLVLNTTSFGANVADDVYDFPLLVRLDGSNFDFTQTAAGGEDLIFTNKDGKTLPFEIERWDAGGQRAEVWVRVDTVYGNDSVQSISMYWGNPFTPDSLAATEVFDTAGGYIGVWHLHDNGTDATGWNRDAGLCTPSDTAGIIGIGKHFSGTDSIVIPTLLGQPQVVALSGWALLESLPPEAMGAEIVSIGDGSLLRMDDMEADTFGVSGSFHLEGETSFHHVCSGEYLEATGWHFCLVVFDCVNRIHTLYIDGVMMTQTTVSDTVNYSEVGVNTLIGVHGNGKTEYNFVGIIDEVRIRNTDISKDRVKLEYMNQKADDELLQFIVE